MQPYHEDSDLLSIPPPCGQHLGERKSHFAAMYKSLQKAIDLMDGFCWRAAIDVSVPTSADFAERGKQRRLTVDNVRETWQESCLGHGH